MFSNSNIKATNSNTLMEDPLAGCMRFMQNEVNARSFLGSVLLRMRLFYPEGDCNKLAEKIISETDHILINKWEYAINESLYEFRKPQKKFDSMYEAAVLNNWAKDLMKRYPDDQVLDFVGMVRQNRQKRAL